MTRMRKRMMIRANIVAQSTRSKVHTRKNFFQARQHVLALLPDHVGVLFNGKHGVKIGEQWVILETRREARISRKGRRVSLLQRWPMTSSHRRKIQSGKGRIKRNLTLLHGERHVALDWVDAHDLDLDLHAGLHHGARHSDLTPGEL